MIICPIVSTKEKKSGCIKEACDFFDGCMLLDAYDTACECSDQCDKLQEDVDAAWSEANGARIDHDALVGELNS